MNVILVLIPVTLLIVLAAVAIFFWAVNHQQFDDLDSPAVLPLMEDDPAEPPEPAETGTPTSPAPSP
jgi:cbb3-type cytochrome oxidase maturation protein